MKDDRSPLNRRALVRLIAVLAVVQVAVLVYLGLLLNPAYREHAGGPTPLAQPQLPSTATAAAGGAGSTPEGPEEIVVGPLVPATNILDQARMFDEELALEHVIYLASAELEGRQPGTPGGWAAGDYVAARFADYGLEPAGDEGSYFQTFTVPFGQITEVPLLQVTLPDGQVLTHTYEYRVDYRALTYGYLGAGEGEGPVVWLNRCRPEDFSGQDLVGRIVMCAGSGDADIYRAAIEHRVGGLLLLDREREAPQFRRGGYRELSWVPETIPAYLISDRVAEDLVAGTGYSLDELSLRFTPTPLSATVSIAVAVEEREEVEARNVLGLLPGSDPEYSDEVVVVCAHYDHLGLEPDGAVMYGANDNASGVATVLEIARMWQAQGYRPARSVLFAAWDAEELGLLGSRYYVANATLPLTQTIAVLNLDMVGAGEALQIDGEALVGPQLLASSELYGITTTLFAGGRSDHVSFVEARVPAAMLIYWPDEAYHTPSDGLEAVQPDRLRGAGVLSAHTLAVLADGYPELERAVARLEATIAAGDREAFLEGLDPAEPDLRATQAAWLDGMWSRGLAEVQMRPRQIRLGDGEAWVTLDAAYAWSDGPRQSPMSYDVRFVDRNGTWFYAGYELETASDDLMTVECFPRVPWTATELLTTTRQVYESLFSSLGLQPISGTRIVYYSSPEQMRLSTRPADEEVGWRVSAGGLVELTSVYPITPALVSLALSEMGLPPGAAPWLREGMVLQTDDGARERYLRTLATSDALTSPLAVVSVDDLPEVDRLPFRAQSWSMTAYLLERYGIDGLQDLCAAWGRTGDADAAFERGLGLTAEAFRDSWLAEWITPLRAAAAAIQSTVDARVDAVLSDDPVAFMATVDPADPVLRTEEQNWFADLRVHPIVSYTSTVRSVDWSPGEDEAIASLAVSAVVSGSAATRSTQYDARFVRDGGRWLYADLAWEVAESEHFLLRHQGHDLVWAQQILDLAEEAYERIVTDPDVQLPLPIEIKLYDDEEVFRGRVSLSLPDWVTARSEPGEAIRLSLGDDADWMIQRAIGYQLVRLVLNSQGLESAWLREGLATFETGRLRPLGAHWAAGEHMPLVQEAVRRHEELSLDALASFEDLTDDQLELAHSQSWSMVAYIVERYGLDGVRRLVASTVDSGDVRRAFGDVLGTDAETLLEDWREYMWSGGTPGELVPLAQRFDPQRALAQIEILSSPAYGGRAPGTEGAERAAGYIAERFAALGLEPLGDPLPDSEAGERGYLQTFPISVTQILSVPVLFVTDVSGAPLREFTYREELMEVVGEGVGAGELVLLQSGASLEGMRFAGAVALERDVDDPIERATDLQARGASGLVVVSDAGLASEGPGASEGEAAVLSPYWRRQAEAYAWLEETETPASPLLQMSAITIPVVQITTAAFDDLTTLLGLEEWDLVRAPPALPLGVQAHLSISRSPFTTTLSANVLGLLPGSDPELADEVLLLGAHYDHVGQAADGLVYPGANHNASGVAAMLEMARVWRSADYRPARSVLFAVWGAEELGSAGLVTYLRSPAVPITNTVAVIGMDGIGGGEGYRLLFYGTRDDDMSIIYPLEAGAGLLERRAWRRGSAGEGWHQAFRAAGIPTTWLIWDGAEQSFYLPTDTAESIDPDRLATSGEILTLTATWLTAE